MMNPVSKTLKACASIMFHELYNYCEKCGMDLDEDHEIAVLAALCMKIMSGEDWINLESSIKIVRKDS